MVSESIAEKGACEQARTQGRGFTVAMVGAVVLCAIFAGGYFSDEKGSCKILVDARINPNTATAASLIRLGGIGPKRAEAIIEYRRGLKDGNIAFEKAEDLQKISGIGPKTVKNMRGQLKFD